MHTDRNGRGRGTVRLYMYIAIKYNDKLLCNYNGQVYGTVPYRYGPSTLYCARILYVILYDTSRSVSRSKDAPLSSIA